MKTKNSISSIIEATPSRVRFLIVFGILLLIPATFDAALAVLFFLPFTTLFILVAGFILGRIGLIMAFALSLAVLAGAVYRLV